MTEPEPVTYTVQIHSAPDIGGYWIDCPEFPGCVTQGESVPDALRMMAEAWELMEDE